MYNNQPSEVEDNSPGFTEAQKVSPLQNVCAHLSESVSLFNWLHPGLEYWHFSGQTPREHQSRVPRHPMGRLCLCMLLQRQSCPSNPPKLRRSSHTPSKWSSSTDPALATEPKGTQLKRHVRPPLHGFWTVAPPWRPPPTRSVCGEGPEDRFIYGIL